MRNLLLKLAYSNVWIALQAGGQAIMTQVMLDLPLDPRAPWLCFLSMLFVYTFAKTVRFDPTADALNDPERTAFLLRWRAPLIAAGVLGFGLGAWQAYRWQVLFLYIFPVLTAVLYDVKLLSAGYRYRRLKDITGVKSVVVAVTWSVLGTLLPVSLSGQGFSAGVAFLLVWHFAMFFVNTVYFDLGDMKGDRAEGTLTLPLWLGFRATRALLLAITLACAAGLWLAARSGLVGPEGHFVNLLTLYQLAFVWAARDESTDLGFLCDVVADGAFLVGGVLALLGRLAYSATIFSAS